MMDFKKHFIGLTLDGEKWSEASVDLKPGMVIAITDGGYPEGYKLGWIRSVTETEIEIVYGIGGVLKLEDSEKLTARIYAYRTERKIFVQA